MKTLTKMAEKLPTCHPFLKFTSVCPDGVADPIVDLRPRKDPRLIGRCDTEGTDTHGSFQEYASVCFLITPFLCLDYLNSYIGGRRGWKRSIDNQKLKSNQVYQIGKNNQVMAYSNKPVIEHGQVDREGRTIHPEELLSRVRNHTDQIMDTSRPVYQGREDVYRERGTKCQW